MFFLSLEMYAKKWLDHVWESFSKIVCVCVEFQVSIGLDNRFLDEWSFTSLPTSTNVMVGLEFLTKDVFADIWIHMIYIDLSNAVTSFPHNIYSLQYLLQHFSKTSRNVAGHSRAGTLMGAFQLKGRAGKPTWRPKIAIFWKEVHFSNHHFVYLS